MMVELKPCPFCGGEARILEGFSGMPVFWPECTKCAASFKGYFEIKESAIREWNTRAERTCRNIAANKDEQFLCSECRYELWTGLDGNVFRYCSRCGAKVVNE